MNRDFTLGILVGKLRVERVCFPYNDKKHTHTHTRFSGIAHKKSNGR